MTNCTEKEFSKWYWHDFNELCKNCIKTCKQSHVARVSCAMFMKKNQVENDIQ